MLSHRAAGLALALALTAGLGAAATRVRPDYSVEQLFPAWDDARQSFDRYRDRFPREDARAVVLVTGPDLFTPGGLLGLRELEEALAKLEGVTDVVGPTSAWTAAASRFGPVRERLFEPAMSPEEIRRRLESARADPLLQWNLVPPAGEGASLLLGLDPAYAGNAPGRRRFIEAAETLLQRMQRPEQSLTLSGVPVVRSRIVGLLERDVAVLLPVSVGVVLLLLLLAFRSAGVALAGLATIASSLIWSYGIPGLLGWPGTVVLSILPVIVVIVSVSDTAHVASAYLDRLRRGEGGRDALRGALAESAGPCLTTELVLAIGFLSLLFVRIGAVAQFAAVAAAAMLLTWLANVLVLPLALSLVSMAPPEGSFRLADRFGSLVEWIGRVATGRPRRVLGVAAAILLAALACLPGVRRLYHVFDDLRPGSELEQQIRLAERLHGGLVLSAIHIEAASAEDGAALDPDLVRLADRAARFLLTIPEYRVANSVADLLRPAHRLLAGDDPEVVGDGLPDSREGAAQELSSLADGRLARDFVSEDGRSLAVVGRALDAGSERIAEISEEVERWVAAEQAALDARPGAPRARLTLTGQMRVFKDLNDHLMGGLVASFGAAILVSLAVMSLALRSWRLGLVALVPNASPVVLVVAFMALAGIPLTPVTVMVFSITLVIADDDTIQFMSRFRRRHAELRAAGLPEPEAHRTAALETSREVGPPMLVSGLAVSAGFLVLTLSSFLGPARLGVLVAATLAVAVAADLFLSPVLLARFLPLARRPLSGQAPRPAAER